MPCASHTSAYACIQAPHACVEAQCMPICAQVEDVTVALLNPYTKTHDEIDHNRLAKARASTYVVPGSGAANPCHIVIKLPANGMLEARQPTFVVTVRHGIDTICSLEATLGPEWMDKPLQSTLVTPAIEEHLKVPSHLHCMYALQLTLATPAIEERTSRQTSRCPLQGP